jgi:hypothetical protein
LVAYSPPPPSRRLSISIMSSTSTLKALDKGLDAWTS